MESPFRMLKEESVSLAITGDSNDDDLENNNEGVIKAYRPRKTLKEDFGNYEIRLLVLTQLGYVPIAAAMLMTAFMEPSKEWCETLKNTDNKWLSSSTNEFFSLTVEYGYACHSTSNQTTAMMSSFLMWGALIGSFVCGFLSDKWGRKPVYLGCLFLVTVGHFFLASSFILSWISINVGVAMIGFFCGGYMVTNFVILTEAFELPRSRLLVVSLNGWSVSMAITAFIAWYTRYWLTYHALTGVIGLCLTIVSCGICSESCRWLSANGSHEDAKKIATQITILNDNRKIDVEGTNALEWYKILGFSAPTHGEEKKTWKTLFKTARFLKPTIVMFYCFLASSIVSFGFYFSIDALPGNRYFNMAVMGILKFLIGFTPFLLNKFITKRAIAISSVGLCCISAFLIVLIQYCDISGMKWLIILLSLLISGGIDPTWKINHLYSAELFPTSVRSMARGVCNAGGRLGSVMAPMIVYLRVFGNVVPNVIFSVLLLIQLIVIAVCLPNDSDKNANEMNDE